MITKVAVPCALQDKGKDDFRRQFSEIVGKTRASCRENTEYIDVTRFTDRGGVELIESSLETFFESKNVAVLNSKCSWKNRLKQEANKDVQIETLPRN